MLLCLIGNIIVVYSDIKSNLSTNPLLGDFLCIGSYNFYRISIFNSCLISLGSSVLYAISNVGAEKYIKESSQIEYLTFLGFWGTLISMLQIAILERSEVAFFFSLNFSWAAFGLLFGFGSCMKNKGKKREREGENETNNHLTF